MGVGLSDPAPYFFIVNPRAGTGIRVFNAVSDRLRKLGVPFSAAATTGPGDATVLAQMARTQNFHAIVAVGGDGTLNDVVTGLLTPEGTIDDSVTVGLIPRGTAQDFARGMELPLTPAAALDRLLEGNERRIDVGRVHLHDGTARLFLNVLGVGFDAEVAGRASEVRPAMASLPAHVLGFASAFADYRSKEISLVLFGDEKTELKSKCNLVVAANGPYYGTGMRLAPGASMDDGLLDVVVIGDSPKLEMLLQLPRAFTGTMSDHGSINTHRAHRILLDSPEEALVQADGELVGSLPAEVDVLPMALRVFA
jgi:diacylglycerol kinase (ATP)